MAWKYYSGGRLGGVVGLSLAFYTQGYGLELGPRRWTFMAEKIDSGPVLSNRHVEELIRNVVVVWKFEEDGASSAESSSLDRGSKLLCF
ncbi:hypothetical protein TNCV_2677781 [Trichonephila clavipes]|nr:hypothetical protein TNCV_2677781 [Trichonephila clavipes]